MNPYIIRNPYRFTTGAPTPNSEPFQWDFEKLKDVKQQILEHAAVTETVSYSQWVSRPLGAETPYDDRRLEDMQVECQITWIFKRHRKNIKNAHGKLDVTIKRSLKSQQTCIWWKRLTREEKNACERNLQYEQTWFNVQTLFMTAGSWNQYEFEFYVGDENQEWTWTKAPVWAQWAKQREENTRNMFQEKLSLQRTEGGKDIYYSVNKS
jgi:hypothetical protein